MIKNIWKWQTGSTRKLIRINTFGQFNDKNALGIICYEFQQIQHCYSKKNVILKYSLYGYLGLGDSFFYNLGIYN